MVWVRAVESDLSNNSLDRLVKGIYAHTLAPLGSDIAKLICLSSTCDYNTGQYQHEGLAWHGRLEDADAALRIVHTQMFKALVFTPLKSLVTDLERFFALSLADPKTGVRMWKDLEPYRMAVPAGTNSLYRELFCSNIRIALAVLENRQSSSPKDQQSTSPMQ